MSYFSNISNAIGTTLKGLSLSIKYFFEARKKRKKESVLDDNYFDKANGTFTVQYPHEQIPIPDHGRYQLHNEIDDCIVCDKCAKICPVDCIDIEPVRSPEVFGQTSDGTPLRIHAAKFDIDMSKCCFCGLCTVVCPTECLTMTKEFDFSTTDILDHNFSFSKMTDKEITEKKKEFEEYQAEKTKAKPELPSSNKDVEVMKKPAAKPVFKPRIPKKK
ncbi:4Fe-4S dicluster domain-containing protein [Ekhidna sp.]|uniref:4Fe-4S dicluster domain-containing protein n=1 Tax=Ekhidna sp. TaxID=2608089 RepID=UPI0035180AC4